MSARRDRIEMLAVNRPITVTDVAPKYKASSHRLIILDYDGVTVPAVVHPGHTIPSDEVKKIVRQLSDDEKNTVVLISNRDKSHLETHWFDTNTVLVAENGALYHEFGKKWASPFDYNAAWLEWVAPALNSLSFQFDGTFVERKSTSICWHYATAKQKLSQKDVRQILAAIRALPHNADFSFFVDENVVELSTPGIDAGSFMARWIGGKHFDFILALGESRIDDALFGLFTSSAITIRVNPKLLTGASNVMHEQADVLPFLSGLTRL